MQTRSAAWDEIYANNGGLETSVIIDNTEYTDASVPVITRALMQDNISIGNVVSAVCMFSMDASNAVGKSAEVVIKMRMTDNDEESPTTSEWLANGTYYVSKRVKDPITNVVTYECYDALLKTNSEWETAFTTWPQSMTAVAGEIATIIGVTIDPRTVLKTGVNYVIAEPAEGTIMRDVLATIAAYNGGNWVMTHENKLRLVPINSADGAGEAITDVIDVQYTINNVLADSAREITGIRCLNNDGTSYLVGDDTGIVIDTTIPAMIALDLAETLLGKTYQPFTLDGCHYNPAVELGDYVLYYDDVASIVCSEYVKLGVSPNGVLSAPDVQEVEDEYPYVSKSDKTLAVAKAYVNEVVNDLNKELTQQEIFDRLTGHGVAQGLLLTQDGQLYVNATYLRGGIIDGDLVSAKKLSILDAENNVVASFDNTIVLGAPEAANARIDTSSLRFVDEYGKLVFVAGDNSEPKVVETFVSTGDENERFSLSGYVYEMISVTVNGEEAVYAEEFITDCYTWDLMPLQSGRPERAIVDYTYWEITPDPDDPDAETVEEKTRPLVEGDVVVITYRASPKRYYYNIGTRASDSEIPGSFSTVIGENCSAPGYYSQAQGLYTTAKYRSQHVFGECNIPDSTPAASSDTKGNYIEIVGNGEYTAADRTHEESFEYSNARTLDWDGNEWIAGALSVGDAAQTRENLGVTPENINAATQITIPSTAAWSDMYTLFDTIPDGTTATFCCNGGTASTLLSGSNFSNTTIKGTITRVNSTTYDVIAHVGEGTALSIWRINGLSSASATPTITGFKSFVSKAGDTMTGSLIVGQANDTAERQVMTRAASGRIYMRSTGDSTGVRGMYGYNNAGTGGVIFNVDQSNRISAVAPFATRIQYIMNPDDYSSAPSDDESANIAQVLDNNNYIRHNIYAYRSTSNSYYTMLAARYPASSTSNTICQFGVGFAANGTPVYSINQPAAFKRALTLENVNNSLVLTTSDNTVAKIYAKLNAMPITPDGGAGVPCWISNAAMNLLTGGKATSTELHGIITKTSATGYRIFGMYGVTDYMMYWGVTVTNSAITPNTVYKLQGTAM